MKFLWHLVLLVSFVVAGAGTLSAADLPICSNRVINAVASRVGCTVGDARCWLTKGGFCTDYIEKKTRRGQSGPPPQLVTLNSDKVRKGDVAQFLSRAHYAYVEGVVRDASGKPVAVNLSEYNFGNCYVDEESLVTDKYMYVNRRSGVPIGSVDGGFLRPRSTASSPR